MQTPLLRTLSLGSSNMVNQHGAFTFDLTVWVFPSHCLQFIYMHQSYHLSDMVTRASICGYRLWPGTLHPCWDSSLGGPPGLLSGQSLPLPGQHGPGRGMGRSRTQNEADQGPVPSGNFWNTPNLRPHFGRVLTCHPAEAPRSLRLDT